MGDDIDRAKKQLVSLSQERLRVLDKLDQLLIVFRTLTTGVTTMLQNYYEGTDSCPVDKSNREDCQLLERFRDYIEIITRRLSDIQSNYKDFINAISVAYTSKSKTAFEIAIEEAVKKMAWQLEEFVGNVPAEPKMKWSEGVLNDAKRIRVSRAESAIYRSGSAPMAIDDKQWARDKLPSFAERFGPSSSNTPVTKAKRLEAHGQVFSKTDWANEGAERLQVMSFGTLVGLMQELTVMSTSLRKKLRSIARSLQKIIAWLYGDIVLMQTIMEALRSLKGSGDDNLLREAVRNIYLKQVAYVGVDERREMAEGRVLHRAETKLLDSTYRGASAEGLNALTTDITTARYYQEAAVNKVPGFEHKIAQDALLESLETFNAMALVGLQKLVPDSDLKNKVREALAQYGSAEDLMSVIRRRFGPKFVQNEAAIKAAVPWKYQLVLADAAYQYIRETNSAPRCLLYAPTGTGKSLMITYLLAFIKPFERSQNVLTIVVSEGESDDINSKKRSMKNTKSELNMQGREKFSRTDTDDDRSVKLTFMNTFIKKSTFTVPKGEIQRQTFGMQFDDTESIIKVGYIPFEENKGLFWTGMTKPPRQGKKLDLSDADLNKLWERVALRNSFDVILPNGEEPSKLDYIVIDEDKVLVCVDFKFDFEVDSPIYISEHDSGEDEDEIVKFEYRKPTPVDTLQKYVQKCFALNPRFAERIISLDEYIENVDKLQGCVCATSYAELRNATREELKSIFDKTNYFVCDEVHKMFDSLKVHTLDGDFEKSYEAGGEIQQLVTNAVESGNLGEYLYKHLIEQSSKSQIFSSSVFRDHHIPLFLRDFWAPKQVPSEGHTCGPKYTAVDFGDITVAGGKTLYSQETTPPLGSKFSKLKTEYTWYKRTNGDIKENTFPCGVRNVATGGFKTVKMLQENNVGPGESIVYQHSGEGSFFHKLLTEKGAGREGEIVDDTRPIDDELLALTRKNGWGKGMFAYEGPKEAYTPDGDRRAIAELASTCEQINVLVKNPVIGFQQGLWTASDGQVVAPAFQRNVYNGLLAWVSVLSWWKLHDGKHSETYIKFRNKDVRNLSRQLQAKVAETGQKPSFDRAIGLIQAYHKDLISGLISGLPNFAKGTDEENTTYADAGEEYEDEDGNVKVYKTTNKNFDFDNKANIELICALAAGVKLGYSYTDFRDKVILREAEKNNKGEYLNEIYILNMYNFGAWVWNNVTVAQVEDESKMGLGAAFLNTKSMNYSPLMYLLANNKRVVGLTATPGTELFAFKDASSIMKQIVCRVDTIGCRWKQIDANDIYKDGRIQMVTDPAVLDQLNEFLDNKTTTEVVIPETQWQSYHLQEKINEYSAVTTNDGNVWLVDAPIKIDDVNAHQPPWSAGQKATLQQGKFDVRKNLDDIGKLFTFNLLTSSFSTPATPWSTIFTDASGCNPISALFHLLSPFIQGKDCSSVTESSAFFKNWMQNDIFPCCHLSSISSIETERLLPTRRIMTDPCGAGVKDVKGRTMGSDAIKAILTDPENVRHRKTLIIVFGKDNEEAQAKVNKIKRDIADIPGFKNSLKSYEEYNNEKKRNKIREKYEKLLASKSELEAVVKDTYPIGEIESMPEPEQYDDGFEMDVLRGTIAEDDEAVVAKKTDLIRYFTSTPELNATMKILQGKLSEVYDDRYDTINLLNEPDPRHTDDVWDRMLYFAAKEADTYETQRGYIEAAIKKKMRARLYMEERVQCFIDEQHLMLSMYKDGRSIFVGTFEEYGTGLDFYGTEVFIKVGPQSLNKEDLTQLRQADGRPVRMNSHDYIPKKYRTVDFYQVDIPIPENEHVRGLCETIENEQGIMFMLSQSSVTKDFLEESPEAHDEFKMLFVRMGLPASTNIVEFMNTMYEPIQRVCFPDKSVDYLKELLCGGYSAVNREDFIEDIRNTLEEILALEANHLGDQDPLNENTDAVLSLIMYGTQNTKETVKKKKSFEKIMIRIARCLYYVIMFAPFVNGADPRRLYRILTNQCEDSWTRTMFNVIASDLYFLLTKKTGIVHHVATETKTPLEKLGLPSDINLYTPLDVISEGMKSLDKLGFIELFYAFAFYKYKANKEETPIVDMDTLAPRCGNCTIKVSVPPSRCSTSSCSSTAAITDEDFTSFTKVYKGIIDELEK